ncbi:aldolase/citrate lyase family protein [Oceaniglobus ichthyenteri]|uniref:aldolase/citrate lyase family protein n=1 Tax=Oceaniglobus ichthyenteri TaxID=2136177 RepID=UPI000D3D19EE|nr:aldolase/citrate lyase family protein [Oceaniglobus ichthyenteri]
MANLRQRLRGETPLCAVNPGGAGLAVGDALARIADSALFIDCERTAIGITQAAHMARAARAAGLATLLRTESVAPGSIIRYLDCGVDALVVPQVESGAQCAALAQLFDVHAATAPRTALIAQIESVAGTVHWMTLPITPVLRRF